MTRTDESLLLPRVVCDDGALALTFAAPEREMLPPVLVRVALHQRDGSVSPVEGWQPVDPTTVAGRTAACRVEVSCAAERGGLLLTATITNAGPSLLTLEQLDIELGDLDAWWTDEITPSALRVAYCGAHSRSQTSRSFVEPLTVGSSLESWWVGAISGPLGPGLVTGGARPARFVTRVRVQRHAMTAEFPLEQWLLAPGERVILDPLWIGASSTAPHAALERFASVLGAAHAARIGTPPSGWGSWGHWLERIDAGLMRETVHAIDGSPALRRVIDVVQIDDGWSELLDSRRVSASWLPNPRFPSGLAPLAAEIARTGRRCGLWILPFAVNAGSALLSSHPEWLVQDAAGRPKRIGGTEAYCLDPTHPGAAAWLRDVFRRLSDWGIDYVKLDFLRALLAPDPEFDLDSFREPRRYHGASTRLEAYRVGLTVIRAAVGERTTLVACSAPAAAGVGLIDCHRIGPDIERSWTGRLAGIRDASRALAANWFWQGRTWVNDPDYLLVCESEPLTRLWATVVALSGGSMVLSADLSTLAPWAESILAFVMPPVGRAARPLDLFSHGPEPRRWSLPFERGTERWTMLGVLNWGERPIAERIAPHELGLRGPLHVWDAWRQRHSIADECITVPVEAQSAALLRLTELTNEPTMIGTDIHWAQGWCELTAASFDAASGIMRLVTSATSPRVGRAWIWVPDGWTIIDGATPAGHDLGVVNIGTTHEAVISFSRTTHDIIERNSRAS